MWFSRFVFLLHHEDRVSNRTKACTRRRIRDDRLLIHLRYERKKHLLFLLDMRVHFATKFFNQFGYLQQLRISIIPLCRDFRCHLSQSRKFLTDAMVMSADDVLDQATKRYIERIECQTTRFFNLSVSKLFENLIDREFQLPASGLERQVRLHAQINIESIKNAGCGWLAGYDLADRLRCSGHKHSPPATLAYEEVRSSNLCHSKPK